MHFAFIRFSSMGDIVLQTPLFAWIKLHFPSSKISLITASEFEQLFLDHPFIDEVIPYKKQRGMADVHALKKLARDLDADFIFDLHNTLRAKLLRLFSWNKNKIVVNKRSLRRFFLIKFKVNFLKDLSTHHKRVIEDFSFLFNQKIDFSKLEEFIQLNSKLENKTLTTTSLSFKQEIPSRIEIPYIIISPVASFENKRWPIERFIELVKKILDEEKYAKYNFVVLGGPLDNFCKQMDEINSDRIHNFQGQTSILESNEIIARSVMTITNDTGVAHLSESFGKPVITFFGPTHPDFGFMPHLEKSKVLFKNLSCSPCSATGSRACSQSSLLCMEGIEVSEAYNAFSELEASL